MAERVPAKSILKQAPTTPQPTLSDEEKAKAERDRRNLGIALHHANRIQHQKNIQAQILSNIETLLDFPASNSYTQPEASEFASLVQIFQPSDFDSLVEERRIDSKCGYPLCSNGPRSLSMGASAAWKLNGRGAEDYCSNACLRKALYVKSQLSEVPAWEREPGQQAKIVLEDEGLSSQSPMGMASRDGGENKAELARERGEASSSFRPGQVMASDVVEKATVSPSIDKNEATASHTAIEGYEPTSNFNQDRGIPEMSRLSLNASASSGLSEAPQAENEENEAWRDLFDNLDKR